jgi:hypothetical protein
VATLKPTRGRIPGFNPSAPAERGLMLGSSLRYKAQLRAPLPMCVSQPFSWPGIIQLIDRSAAYLRDAGYEVVDCSPSIFPGQHCGLFRVGIDRHITKHFFDEGLAAKPHLRGLCAVDSVDEFRQPDGGRNWFLALSIARSRYVNRTTH